MTAEAGQIAQIRQHFAAGRLEQAKAIARRLVQKSPGHAEAAHSYAIVLYQCGEKDLALFHLKRALQLAPGNGEYRGSYGHLLVSMGKRAEALGEFARAAELEAGNPGHALAMVPLLWENGDHDGALAAAERGMALDPVGALGPYTSVLMNIGEIDRAAAELRRALESRPEDLGALASLAMAMNYLDADPDEVFEVHRRAGAALARGIVARGPVAGVGGSERRLRVGFLSPDLYQHSVAHFLEPILRHLDTARFEAWCYSARAGSDGMTERLRGLADQWRDVSAMSDDAVAKQIAADGVAVLVDLAGMTGQMQLRAMARRPAAVQVAAIGYPNTTGLAVMDYRLVDEVTDPVGTEKWATERLVRLPRCFLCYSAPVEAPEPSEPPCLKSGVVTFGTFNNSMKISQRGMEVWGRVLREVPGSRLLIKSMQFACASVRERYAVRLREAGIEMERVEIAAPIQDRGSHLAAYSRLDIALDTFPYNGTTTTCEALWMGVPVVTLEGRVHAGRVGASLLKAAGMGENVARSPEEFVAIAARLAGDQERLAAERTVMRERVRASALMDGAAYGARWWETIQGLWLARGKHAGGIIGA